jgi:thymidylate synthase (FAD)
MIKCNTNGYVRLVDHMGSDLSAVRSARVSYDADWREDNKSSDRALLRYLVRNKHTSPLESIVFTFEVKAEIFVLRQWMRHRTWAYNEVSARYTELPEDYFVPNVDEITTQHKDNKQMRSNEVNQNAFDIKDLISTQNAKAFTTYQSLIQLECPRELARSVLPVGTYSRMFATVNLHNLFHFLRLRLHPHAQKEIQVYAAAMLELIRPFVPILAEAFDDYVVNARTFSAQEMDILWNAIQDNVPIEYLVEMASENLSKTEAREFMEKFNNG